MWKGARPYDRGQKNALHSTRTKRFYTSTRLRRHLHPTRVKSALGNYECLSGHASHQGRSGPCISRGQSSFYTSPGAKAAPASHEVKAAFTPHQGPRRPQLPTCFGGGDLFPRLRGFGENVRPFIPRLRFFSFSLCNCRLARAH